METAIVIDAVNSEEGIAAERVHIDGAIGSGWQKELRCLIQLDGKSVDQVTVRLGSRTYIFWFDITAFLPFDE